ncbi:unnamed protein product [Dovyalis caffra]|uniref:RNase H type-1 domain-containing protein n=1 Tax=Dovyalis caffra TaxID=77055 RepID=A0AAV1QR02_9ROSI|nr:unnamed protein product [Dovyalis caffra]
MPPPRAWMLLFMTVKAMAFLSRIGSGINVVPTFVTQSFDEVVDSLHLLRNKAGQHLEEIWAAQTSNVTNLSSSLLVAGSDRWTKPPLGKLRSNVDGAVDSGQKNISVGVVIRDENGDFIAATTRKKAGFYDVLTTEADAALWIVNEFEFSELRHKRAINGG